MSLDKPHVFYENAGRGVILCQPRATDQIIMSKDQLDVYRDWLGIKEPNRPLNFYQLLRLRAFEDNPAQIRENYRKLNTHVRKFASGDFLAESQALLNELAKAMLCLTDTTRKQEYDVLLGRKIDTAKARRSLEEILVGNGLVPAERMKQVKSYADAVGIDLQEAVLQQKIETASPEAVMLAYAESIGLPFISVEDVGVDENIAVQINPNTARQHSFVPLMVDRGQLLLASPKPVNPDVEEELKMTFEMPVRSTICTQNDINAAIARYYPRDAVQMVQKGQATTATASKKSSKPAQNEPSEPMTPEEIKNRWQTALVSLNFSTIVTFALLYFLKIPRSIQSSTTMAILLFIASAVVVGLPVAYAVWNKLTR